MSSSVSVDDTSMTQLLHLILLEASLDFIHVIFLKGSFLYVTPSVRKVLGYYYNEPDKMISTSIYRQLFTHIQSAEKACDRNIQLNNYHDHLHHL